MRVVLKDHMKMVTTGENMVRKTSLEPNIPGERTFLYPALEKNHKFFLRIKLPSPWPASNKQLIVTIAEVTIGAPSATLRAVGQQSKCRDQMKIPQYLT